jgi:putative ATPase
VLEPLSEDELGQLLDRALALGAPKLVVDPPARDMLVAYADGDGRRLVNLVEYLATAAGEGRTAPIDVAFVEGTIAKSLRRFDKGGEAFYDQISALHKAVRGSHPDAALYWMCRMLDGGADPLYVGRRLIRMATEDIGLADPRALSLTTAAVETYERLGTPEGELALAEAVIYLACAAKSNAVYAAYNAARAFIAEDGSRPVPLRLRNAPTKLMKGLGYGKGYRYAHDEADAYAAGERYLPDDMPDVSFYKPSDRGFESRIADRLRELRARDDAQGGRSAPPADDD